MQNRFLRELKKDIIGYAFIAPSLICFILFIVYPAVDAVRISFFELKQNAYSFVGLKNFIDLFNSDVFIKALLNTFKYVIFVVPLTMVLSLFISAIIYNKHERVTSFYRAVFYIPTIASAVAVSLVWSWIFDPMMGIANFIMSLFKMNPVSWLSTPETAFYCVIFVILTWSVGQPIILYTAALGGIPNCYYEAARIDGASYFRQFISISLPLVKSTTLYILVITTINAFQTFAVINLLTHGGPNNSTTSVIYLLYKTAFVYNNHGYASAMGVILFLIVGVVAIFQFKFLTSNVEY